MAIEKTAPQKLLSYTKATKYAGELTWHERVGR